WSTLYNFRFTCDKAPAAGNATLGLWKNPTASSTATSANAAATVPSGPPPIAGDLDGNGSVDAADLATMLSAWGTNGADLNGDNSTDASDLAILLGNWG
ncbi:MAG: Dockerin type domain, partial [Planctomycetota bacterium]